MSRDRDASGKAIQDIRTSFRMEGLSGRRTLPDSPAVGIQIDEKNSAAVCRIGNPAQDRKEGLRDGAFSFFTVFKFSC